MTLQDYYYLSILIENARAEDSPLPAYLQGLDETAKSLNFDSNTYSKDRGIDKELREKAEAIYNMYPKFRGARRVVRSPRLLPAIENLIKKYGFSAVESAVQGYINEAGDFVKDLERGLRVISDILADDKEESEPVKIPNKYGRLD